MEDLFLALMYIPAIVFIALVGTGIFVVLALMLNFVLLCIMAAISEVFYFVFLEV